MFEVKHCPFCGGISKIKKCSVKRWVVMCMCCGAHGSKCKTPEMAVEKWNWRVW